MERAVTLSQIHSANVRIVGESNAGEGTVRERGDEGDGFATKERGIIPIIKTADCVPILLCGTDKDGKPVVSAVHAGWRGTVSGIAAEAVAKMKSLGAVSDSICAAVGAHIGVCCYEVGESFIEEVKSMRGEDFVRRHVDFTSYEKPHANLSSMNREFSCRRECGKRTLTSVPTVPAATRKYTSLTAECTAKEVRWAREL